ncbi:transposase [Accumulibacter sp.]|uniref:transposase n=1 Tax=Accumulibacter sp. TaxID=2053492 RepID=UPI001AC0F003|nr:transposase [Accumulibacter sp.]MBO3716905.1 transposase [Accumulibacter sp.]
MARKSASGDGTSARQGTVPWLRRGRAEESQRDRDLLESISRPLTVILDNASIHKRKEIRPLLTFLEQKGFTLFFLPPYSPEFNLVEKLWPTMKYEWMALKPGTLRRWRLTSTKFWTASSAQIIG